MSRPLNIAVFGSSGAIGKEFINYFLKAHHINKIFSFSRSETNFNNGKIIEKYINYDDDTIIEAANFVKKNSTLDIVIIASGILYEGNIMPEKSLRDLTLKNFQRLFLINTIFPALIAKYFIPLMNKEKKSVLLYFLLKWVAYQIII